MMTKKRKALNSVKIVTSRQTDGFQFISEVWHNGKKLGGVERISVDADGRGLTYVSIKLIADIEITEK